MNTTPIHGHTLPRFISVCYDWPEFYPCPVCGGTAKLSEILYGWPAWKTWACQNKECGKGGRAIATFPITMELDWE